jgi:hypothetical protein
VQESRKYGIYPEINIITTGYGVPQLPHSRIDLCTEPPGYLSHAAPQSAENTKRTKSGIVSEKKVVMIVGKN